MSRNAKALLLSVIGGVALMGMAIPAHAVIKVTKVANWLGNPAWKIEGAANGTFYFESGDAGKTGFSSAIDQENNDWILNDGKTKVSGGNFEYRGFPNFGGKIPSKNGDSDFNHPQRNSGSSTKWKDDKMEGDYLVMESWNTTFKVEYHFFPSHIAIKVIQADDKYAFLYEGPIGGKHEPGVDWSVGESDPVPGTERKISNSNKNGVIDPIYPNKSFGKFFYLGDPVAKQVLFFAKTPVTTEGDEGWGQGANMSIFSFGRWDDIRKLTGTANICTFGFLNKADGYAKIKPFIEGTLANPFVAAGGGTPPGTGGASGSGDGGVVATGGTTGSSDAAAMGGAPSSGGAIGSGGSSTTSGGTTTSSGGSTTTTSGGIAAKGGSTASSGGTTSATGGKTTTASGGGTTTATGGVKASGGSTGTKTSGDSGGCSFGSSSGGVAGFGMAMFALGMLMLRRRRSSK